MWMYFGRLWRNFRHRDANERDLHDELEAIQTILADEKTGGGMLPDDARRAAAIELGGLESIKEGVRHIRAGALVDTILKDLHQGLRLLRRNPLLTVTATLSLAIGIGATTAIFSIANGLLLQTAPGVADPSRLVDIAPTRRGGPPGIIESTYPDFLDLQRQVTTLRSVYAYQLNLAAVSLRVDGGAERAYASLVSTNYFDALGVSASAGRLFMPRDPDGVGATPSVVLSHRFWSRRFNRDASIVGRLLRINGLTCTVIGVAAPDFNGTTILSPDLWLPLGMVGLVEPGTETLRLTTRRATWLMLGGRLRDGATSAQASAEVQLIASSFQHEVDPRTTPRPGVNGIGTRESLRTPSSIVWTVERSSPIPSGVRSLAASFIALLMALVSVVLLVTCANLAGVLLARATARRREIGVRVAIGAGRGRIIRQLLTETLLLFLLGSLGALILARFMRAAVLTLLPAAPVPIDLHLTFDARVVGFALVTGLVAAVLSGLAPALHAAGADVVSALKDDAAPAARVGLRNIFVVGQLAFSLAVIVVTALLVKALGHTVQGERGFTTRGVDIVSVDLQTAGYSESAGLVFVQQLLDQARSLPGVTAAAVANRLPGGAVSLGYLRRADAAETDPLIFMNWTVVTPGYFAALQIPLVAGRDFSDVDTAATPAVAIVGETAARRLWPGQDPIGQRLLAYAGNPEQPSDAPPVPLQIVGVAREQSSGSAAPLRMGNLLLYVPITQRFQPHVTLFTRSVSTVHRAGDLRQIVASLDSNLAVLNADTLDHQLDGPVETQLRIAAVVGGSVGIVGLLLAGLGVYGVTMYAVTRRTREMAVRLALGAANADVVGLVLRQGMTLVGIGAVTGGLLALGAGSVVSARQLGVPRADAATLAMAVLLFAVIGGIACYVPVRRASRINAADALRAE